MTEKLKNIFAAVKKYFTSPEKTVSPILECLAFSFVMNLILESLSRHNPLSALWHLVSAFPFFLVGVLTVALTMSIALFFRRRYFVYIVVSCGWLVLGITQAVLMGIRAEPFAAVDFVILLSAFRLVPQYIGIPGIILVILAFAVAGFLASLVFKKFPTRLPQGKKGAAFALILALVLVAVHAVTGIFGWVDLIYNDAPEAYEKYGFAYCFTRSFVDFGVDEPEEYSQSAVEHLTSKLSDSEDFAPTVNGEEANVIFLQLESFFDPKYLKELNLPSDPVPNFTAMKSDGPSGLLRVNTIGGGTANTEFQVLCAMNLSHFGIVEYPFSTILDQNTCPSLATVFSDMGYTCTALHNHTATFYSRHKVYANLGFDTFVPVEYMKGVEYNDIGWEKDSVLAGEISDVLDSTEGSDFVFAVSVEGHGNYPDHEIYTDGFAVNSARYADIKYQLEYYINTVHNMDRFLGELTEELSGRDEPVILVVYGDHMPSLDLSAEDLTLGSLYYTEYAVWSNFGMEDSSADEDLDSYSLSPKVLSLLGVKGNAITRLHNERGNIASFQRELELLEYDILYGEGYCSPDFQPNMDFGIRPISIDSVIRMPSAQILSRGTFMICGENFTPFSCVFADGVKKETEFVDENTLMCTGIGKGQGQKITVVQISDGISRLGESESFVFDG